MDILVSFCNTLRTPSRAALGLLDTATSAFRIVPRPEGVPRCAGINGLAASEGYLYAIVQEPAALLVLDRADLTLLSHYVFRSAMDPHSVSVSDGVAHVVSTGTDEVLALRMRGAEVVSETVCWRPEPEGRRGDLHHLNAVSGWRGDLLVSAFGKKEQTRWDSAKSGFIFNISRREQIASGINHPHSLIGVGDTLVYCESLTKTVRVLGGNHAQPQLPGYTRGLCLVGQDLFVGTSVRRRVSKSTGIVNTPAGSEAAPGQCAVTRLSAENLEIKETIDLGAYGDEIYDLLPVEDTHRWPVVSPDSLDRAAANWRHQMELAFQEIAALVPPQVRFILVDGNQWQTDAVVAGRHRVLFLERNGQYWGGPPNDAAAIQELERLRQSGMRFIVFAWPAFWWLDYYTGLRDHLRAEFRCLLENDRLVAFESLKP